ncbi:ParA family protein [Metamycoplasma phocicerebrale]|uniref:ParA family protein n=1 Tax=Metamycoplasma phocicerebrale TaxID=142649 RepID=A0A3T0TUM7_9BACT|nr:ParA family protein [Metamycoplasma phocicerebrale]AZZ65659.1 ParA family protein [Metamycoplasma phocicerebrale]
MKIIAFANNKGGVLKTSLTVNYASVLAKKGYKVLIIDTDSQSNVLASFNNIVLDPSNYSIYDLVFKNKKIDDAIINVFENIDVIPSSQEWQDFDTEATKRFIYEKNFKSIKNILEDIKKTKKYDYVLIDTEPKKSANTFSVLLATEEIIIPFTLESFGIQALTEMYKYVNKAKEANKNLKIKALVATKTFARSKMEKIIKEQSSKFPEPGLCNISIPHSTTGASSVTLKKLPVYLTTKNKLTKAYEELVNLLEFGVLEENNER